MSCIRIDVGAGQKHLYTEWLHHDRNLRIYAIEPHPELAASLRLQFANEIRNESVSVHEIACVADRQPTVTFHPCNQRTCSSTLLLSPEGALRWKYPAGGVRLARGASTTVMAMRVSDFVAAHVGSWQRLRLNVEVQGDALNVLRGVAQPDWDRFDEVTVKVHCDSPTPLYIGQATERDVVAMLSSNGLQLQGDPLVITRGQEKVLCYAPPPGSRTTAKQKRQPPPPPPPQKRVIGAVRQPRFK